MNHQLVSIEFYNKQIIAAKDDNGNVFVAVKPICEQLGVAWNGQFERIKRDSVLNSVVRMIRMPALDGKFYETCAIPLEYLNGWLFGIDDSRLKKQVKELVIKYKKRMLQSSL